MSFCFKLPIRFKLAESTVIEKSFFLAGSPDIFYKTKNKKICTVDSANLKRMGNLKQNDMT